MNGPELTSMNGGLGLGTHGSGAVAPGYTVVAFSPTHVVLIESSTSGLKAAWLWGTARPDTEETARKTTKA